VAQLGVEGRRREQYETRHTGKEQQGPLLDAERDRQSRFKRALEESEALKKENAKLRKTSDAGN